MILLVYLLKDKIALWWDDINYWAVDAKALYYNGGFAGKYGNVAPEFGDYPPGLQLFKWFVMHLSSDFSEGFVVKGEDSAAFLEEKLEILGLNYKEAEEFIIYWHWTCWYCLGRRFVC